MSSIQDVDVDAGIDWGIISEHEVVQAAEFAALKVRNQYENVCELEDLLQEAYIFLAVNHGKIRRAIRERGYDRVHRLVWQHLTDLVKYERNHASFEVLTEAS